MEISGPSAKRDFLAYHVGQGLIYNPLKLISNLGSRTTPRGSVLAGISYIVTDTLISLLH